MSWQCHIQNIYEKASKRLNVLKSLKYKLNRSTLSCLYKSLIRPLMEYGDVIWDNCTEAEANLLERIQYESARAVTGAIKGSSATRLLSELARPGEKCINCFTSLKLLSIHRLHI